MCLERSDVGSELVGKIYSFFMERSYMRSEQVGRFSVVMERNVVAVSMLAAI